MLAEPAQVRWTADQWKSADDKETASSGLPALHFVDLPTAKLTVGTVIEWTFRWLDNDRWADANFRAEIV